MPAGDPESGADIHQRAGLVPLFPGTEAFVPRDIFRQVVSLGLVFSWSTSQHV